MSCAVEAPFGQRVRELAASLPPRIQLALELAVRHGLGPADIAEVIGLPVTESAEAAGLVAAGLRHVASSCVALDASHECPALARVLGDWRGCADTFPAAAVVAHVDRCGRCGSTRERHDPVAVYAAAPIARPPETLRKRVLDAVRQP